VYQFSFPAPSPTLALTLVILGDGGICGIVSELRDGVEHKFSDLPRDEVCLVFGSYFLRSLSAGKFWMEEDHSHFCSVHWPSSISAQLRRTRVCCCYRAGLLGRGPLGGSGYVDLGSIALGFIYLGSCAATELRNSGMSLTWFRAESNGRHVILQGTLQPDCQIGRP
jgi:hypothetical protein